MKHISPAAASGAVALPPTRRALAKQQTRAKVIAAARRLFSEGGYEGATIRDIAAAAGMSTGAVFANFRDKAELFRDILVTDLTDLLAAMREAAGKGRGVEDALLRAFMAAYAFYKNQLPLARATFSVAWSKAEGEQVRALPELAALPELMAELLTQAVERGELSQNADIRLLAQMLHHTCLSNFPQAIFDGWSLEALQVRARDQIRILLAGARRG